MKKALGLIFFISLLTSNTFGQVNISLHSHIYIQPSNYSPRTTSLYIVGHQIACRNNTDNSQNNSLLITDYNHQFIIPVQLSKLEGVAKVVVVITNSAQYNSSNPLDISVEVPVTHEDGVVYYECNGIKRIIKDHRLMIDTNYITQKSLFYTSRNQWNKSFDFKIEAYDESGNVLGTYSCLAGSGYIRMYKDGL